MRLARLIAGHLDGGYSAAQLVRYHPPLTLGQAHAALAYYRAELGRVRRSEREYYIPDVAVLPIEMAQRLFPQPGIVAVFPEPLPLVVEVWSSTTGRLDVREKLPEYQRRGDLAIWLIHPYERWLRTWVRQPDGTYTETLYQGGAATPAHLRNVTIDLDTLLAG